MEGNKRVYPAGGPGGKWINYLLLFLSAVVVLSGLLWRGNGDGVELNVAATPTPIPTDAVFDETMESREITLPFRTWYALQMGVFEKEDAAKELAQSYRQRGAAGYIWADSRYRTLGALYTTQEDVQRVRSQLRDSHGIDSYVYEITLPALELRMKGMKGQLDILEAAFLHADDLVSRLQELSVLMDRQEYSGAEAVEAVKSLQAQMQTVALRLGQRFSEPRHAAVQGLMDNFTAFDPLALDASQSSVALAAELKYQALAALYRLKAVYDGF